MSQRFDDPLDPKLIEIIRGGGVGVLLTDTVYGLVARAGDPVAIAKLYGVKRRESGPGTTIGASVQDFADLGFSSAQLARVAHYWPAPLSVVLDAAQVPDYLKQDWTSLPVRIPAVDDLLELLRQTGPLMTTSANHHGQPTSQSIDDAVAYFGDRLDFYVDGGIVGDRPASTIIGISEGGQIEVFRAGAFPTSQLI